MNVPSQTALRNRRRIWGSSPHSLGGDQLPRPEHAAGNAAARYPDPAYPNFNCVCSSDHCNGLGGSDACRGYPDRGTDTITADHRPADAFNASTACYLDAGARCCSDPGDCGDVGCGSAGNRT